MVAPTLGVRIDKEQTLKRTPILAVLAIMTLASPVMAIGNAAPPANKLHPPVAPGQTVTVVTPAITAMTAPDGSTWNPTETATVTGLTKTQIAALPGGAVALSPLGATTAASTLAYTSGCWTVKVKYGTSALYAWMSQTWCGSTDPTVLIYYWPKAICNGYSSMWMPSYHYGTCSWDQTYGLYWFGGDTYWHYTLCPAWVPPAGPCWSWYTGNERYTYQANGAWGKTG